MTQRCIPATWAQPAVFLQMKTRQCLSCCPGRSVLPLESLKAIDLCGATADCTRPAFVKSVSIQRSLVECLCLAFPICCCSKGTFSHPITLLNPTVALKWLNNCPFLGTTTDKKHLLVFFELHAKACC